MVGAQREVVAAAGVVERLHGAEFHVIDPPELLQGRAGRWLSTAWRAKGVRKPISSPQSVKTTGSRSA
jgi:hypothetical protein